MKVLFIIHNVSFCGAERVLALVANELVERGYDVYILTDPQDISYPLNDKIHILDAYRYSKTYKTSSTLKKIIRIIKYNIGFSRTLRYFLKEVKPDCIVSFLGFFIWQLLPYRKRYKIIISDHSAMSRALGKKRDYERHILPEKFHYQTVLTSADKELLGSSRTNVVVMNNPLTFKPISIEEYIDNFDKREHILFCGSVDRYEVKGLDNMIRAFAIVRATNKDVILDIAGRGSESKVNELKKLAKELGVFEYINFLGFQEDVASLMKSHSLLVLSSRSEGFGMVIIEAMACGCPVVSYALSGPCEIIENGVNGILVENQNINKLAESVVSLYGNKERLREIGQNALQTVEKYSLKNIADQWEIILKN